jgi:predicted ester cyclase
MSSPDDALLYGAGMGATADLLTELFRRVNERDFASLASELIAPDFVRHDLADLWVGVAGQDGVQDFLGMLAAAAPDLRLDIQDMVEDGDRAAVRFTLSGTHSGGPLLGVQATGNTFDLHAINIYRVADGRVAETWQLSDGLGLHRAVGLA